MILAKDISAINQIQKVKAELKHRSFLTYTITHELKTPTNSIKYLIKEVSEHASPDDKELLDIAESNCEFLLTLINDILDYAKIEEGTLKLAPTLFSLVNKVKWVMKLFTMPVKIKNIKLELDLNEPLPKYFFNIE